MGYRWERPNGSPVHVPSTQLRPADVPPVPTASDDAGPIDDMVRFAHTFHGYKWGGSPTRLGEIYAGVREQWEQDGALPEGIDRLRACLFFWARADRHGGAGPDEEELPFLGALLEGIRRESAS